jgi:hypothetical protein
MGNCISDPKFDIIIKNIEDIDYVYETILTTVNLFSELYSKRVVDKKYIEMYKNYIETCNTIKKIKINSDALFKELRAKDDNYNSFFGSPYAKGELDNALSNTEKYKNDIHDLQTKIIEFMSNLRKSYEEKNTIQSEQQEKNTIQSEQEKNKKKLNLMILILNLIMT